MAKRSTEPVTQRYIVLPGVVIAGDAERWLPGSLIELDDERAAVHLAAGNVAPLDGTTPPAAPEPAVVTHEAEANP